MEERIRRTEEEERKREREKQRTGSRPKNCARAIDTRHDTRYIAEKLPERKLQSMFPVRGTYSSKTPFSLLE